MVAVPKSAVFWEDEKKLSNMIAERGLLGRHRYFQRLLKRAATTTAEAAAGKSSATAEAASAAPSRSC
jgi:hypothetical protein